MFDPKKAGEAADEMIRGLKPSNRTEIVIEDAEPLEQAPAEEESPVVEDGVEDQGATQLSADAGEDTQDGDADSEEQSARFQAQLDELKQELQKADHRYRSLQGVVDKKDRELDGLRALIAQLNEAKPKEADEPAASSAATAADRDNFGDDLIEFVQRMARGVAAAEVTKLETRIAALEQELQGVEQVAAKSNQQLFHEALTRAVPNWQELNVDPEFMSWAEAVDPGTGQTRAALLQAAYAAKSVDRTAYFFNAFQAEKAPPAQEQPPANPAAKFAAPGKSKASTARADAGEKRQWTRASIAKLYEDYRTKQITPAEFDKLERDLFKAQSEGRIAA